jgi:molybdopterin-guanine dinucleotide biosynthesis protein A
LSQATAQPGPYDGIVLAGGAGRRLGGADKPALVIGERTLLDIAVDALRDAATTIVVGPSQPTRRAVRWTREVPPGGGPVAALAAGVAVVTAPIVAVLAADLPFVTRGAVRQLVNGLGAAAGVVAVDDDSRDQPLLACYRTVALAAALPTSPSDAAMRIVTNRLAAAGGIRRLRLDTDPPATVDCDTDEDLARARELS